MRLTMSLLACLAIATGCCPWAEWEPCATIVQVQDVNGQPLDTTLILLNAATGQEFSRTECPGTCVLEIPDLFHNGEWVTRDGLLLRIVANLKIPRLLTASCNHDGMHVQDQTAPGVLIIEMTDAG